MDNVLHIKKRLYETTNIKKDFCMDDFKEVYDRKIRNAKARGVEFLLTFEQFQSLWIESGKWRERGLKKGQYVMARVTGYGTEEEAHDGDLPYEQDCVQIILSTENSSAAKKGREVGPPSKETKAKIRAANKGKPWSALRRAAQEKKISNS